MKKARRTLASMKRQFLSEKITLYGDKYVIGEQTNYLKKIKSLKTGNFVSIDADM